MNVPRLAGITAGIAGVGAAGAVLAMSKSDDADGVGPELKVGLGLAAGGLLALGSGYGIAQWAETGLRPGVARAGRSGAAIGAALIAGSIVGLVGAAVASQWVDNSRTHHAREDVDAAEARVAKAADAAKEAPKVEAQAERADQLGDEAAKADVELQVDDGRIDLVGAPLSAATAAVYGQYDTGDDELYLGDQQRTVGDRTFSIGTAMNELLAPSLAKDASDTATVDRAAFSKLLTDKVDTDAAGKSGIIDVSEAKQWYSEAGPGELDVTWGWKQHLDSIAKTAHPKQPATDATYEVTWSLGQFDPEKHTPMLALPGVETVDEAAKLARQASVWSSVAMVVVSLPDDAPTRYALVRLQGNGNGSYVDKDTNLKPYLSEDVRAVVDADTDLRIDPPLPDVRPGMRDFQ
jgi:hypothetical protein